MGFQKNLLVVQNFPSGGKIKDDIYYFLFKESIELIFDKIEAYLWFLVSSIYIFLYMMYARHSGIARKYFN